MGYTPRWITECSVIGSSYPKMTLHCAAYPDDLYMYSRDEIEMFKQISCSVINNKPLINGGTDLQISMDGQIVPITNGDSSWNGALYYPQFPEDDMCNTLIKWDMIFELQLTNLPADAIYTPDYRLYPNIDYDCWTTDTPALVGGSVTALPGTVTTAITSGTNLFDWSSPNNLKAADGNMAVSYNSSTTPGQSYWIKASNFGFDIDTDTYNVSRVHVRFRYANNSKVRSPDFLVCKTLYTCYGI